MNFRIFGLGGKISALLLLAAAMAFGFTNRAAAQSEEGIKAAYLYNFAKFTTWPAKTFADVSTPITVGFIGADALADLFEANVTGKNANGHDLAVKRLTSPAGAETCQIVFVGDASQAAAVIAALKGKPVLTVGYSDGFASAGGMVNFIKNGAKMSFDLDLTGITSARMELDTKLRGLARNVKGG